VSDKSGKVFKKALRTELNLPHNLYGRKLLIVKPSSDNVHG